MKTFSKPHALWLLLLLLFVTAYTKVQAQATVSYPVAVGTNSCTGTTSSFNYYTYNETTNVLSNFANCTPWLRIGGTSATPLSTANAFKASLASLSYNPKDRKFYYFWTTYSPTVRTYVWSWLAGTTCPGSNTSFLSRQDTLRSFAYDILGVAFDKNGNGYMLEFGTTIPNTGYIRSIDFTTGVIGAQKPLSLTGGAVIYQNNVTGDVAMSPSGQLYFVADNKLFTPDYASYSGAGSTITCTYIDTAKSPGPNFSLIGLTYAQGELIGSYSNTTVSPKTCAYEEIDPLTGGIVPITGTSLRSVYDYASVISGIGVSKKLYSVKAVTGTANQYDVEYDVYVQNYGNYPLTGVQVTDDLRNINTNANVTFTSITLTSNPAGVTLNTAYTGKLAGTLNLLASGQTLSNLPGQNSFTIRIKCRLSNIIQGVVYNNSATATGVGFNNVTVTDVSTNGTLPDLNSNDKPDDAGESQPTPLLISVTAQTPPCASLSTVLYSQDFGSGSNTTTIPLPSTGTTGTTAYNGSTTQPLAVEQYMLASNANAANNARFISLTDHTGNAGRMMIINADVNNSVMYSGTAASLCPNQQYSLLFYAAFVGNASYQTVCDGFGGFKYPRIKMRIKDLVSGTTITEASTADITSTGWNLYGMKWTMPTSYTSLIFELINDAPGGCGNDIALDDIKFGLCNPLPIVSISNTSAGCIGSGASFTSSLSDPGAISGTVVYKWQISSDNVTYIDIAGATASTSTYSIAAVTATDVDKYYRIVAAASGNMGTASCQYPSAGVLLAAKATSTAPTGIVKSKAALCPGESVSLQATGATVGAGAVYKWYTGSCGGTLVGTGNPITVSPTVATTYFVRLEGDCTTTTCFSIAITFSCDIDDDNDGITDVAEYNGLDANADDDFDGIQNYLDPTYPGFVDANSNSVNDNFDSDGDGIINSLDLDSDNDGVPDVAEARGVDADGDGRIDNYTDTDGDGLSQNVDASNTGYLSSGTGLGLPDSDGDGVPDFLDLDSDNDGIPDVVEAGGTDANNNGMIDTYTDGDSDGFSQNVDGDTNNDGVAENAANALLRTGADTNGDGRYDSMPFKNMDGDAKANPYDLDSDGDGISDVREAGFADADFNSKIDGTLNTKGWSTIISALATLSLSNTDGTGKANAYDIDADDDGIPDTIEGLPTTSYLLPSYTDGDGDGIDNTYDDFSGFGGSGINPVNTDGDAQPDYTDEDTDGDGLIDRIEGNDFNLNHLSDDNVTLTGIDTDSDGLDDRFDADNTSAHTTSAYLGNGGILAGPATPGSRTMIQKNFYSFNNRDWRDIGYVLDLEFIDMRAVLKGAVTQVDWGVSGTERIERYIVERSTDGANFQSIQTVSDNAVEKYTITDNLSRISASAVYYRIKAETPGGKIKYSSTGIIKLKNEASRGLTLFPNPAHQSLQLQLYAGTSGQATFTVSTLEGRQAARFVKRVSAGYNTLVYSDVNRLLNGVYILRMELNGVMQNIRFMVRH